MSTSVSKPTSSTRAGRGRVVLLLWRLKVREYFAFGASLYRMLTAASGIAAGVVMLALGRAHTALAALSAVHRAGYSTLADRSVERMLGDAFRGHRRLKPLAEACLGYSHKITTDGVAAQFVANPDALLGPLAMVLRSPTDERKGVLCLQYNYVFPLFQRLFDVSRIAKRYHIVLEPSWSGYCNPEVLCYAAGAEPVFVQAYEPRDRNFITTLGAGFSVVPTSTNWWVDHRIFRPLSHVQKTADIVMVAGWGDYKRHAQFFRALKALRRSLPNVKVILVGYRLGMTLADIVGLADHYGVADTLECFENLTQEEVNVQLNRARVNVLWSRKEGVNRAIIEGMFADLPCIVREGFNYGYPYEYINRSTGAFAAESELPRVILELLELAPRMRTREWVMNHMSCQVSTRILAEVIANTRREPLMQPDGDIAVKVNGLHGMHYWDVAAAEAFEEDYRFLRSSRR